jgi:hypothetical protein
MSQLRKEHTHYVTPRTEGSRHGIHPGLARKFRNKMRRNQVAKLSQNSELGCGWFGLSFFHLCRVTELKSHSNHFFSWFNQDSYGVAVVCGKDRHRNGGRWLPLTGLAKANILVAKFDSNGNLKWQTVYTSPSALGIGYSIVQTSDGGYMVGGYDNDSPFLGLALKLGSNGQVQWAKTYNISGAARKFFLVRQT